MHAYKNDQGSMRLLKNFELLELCTHDYENYINALVNIS